MININQQLQQLYPKDQRLASLNNYHPHRPQIFPTEFHRMPSLQNLGFLGTVAAEDWDFTDDMDNAGLWLQQDSGNIGISGGKQNINVQRDDSNDASSRNNSSTISDTTWITRSVIDMTTVTQGSSPNALPLWLGWSSLDSSNNSAASFDFIGMEQRMSSTLDRWATFDAENSGLDIAFDTAFTRAIQVEGVGLQTIRSSGTAFSGELFNTGFSSSLESQNGTCDVNTINLQYWGLWNVDIANGGEDSTLIETNDVLQFRNGVTTPP